MKRKELVLLMSGLTKGGKTTIAETLCHKKFRKQMALLGNSRTEVTVDWTFDPDASQISLEDISLNEAQVFGTDKKETFSCEKFSEILDSEDGPYLKDILGLEKQEGLSAEELDSYVSGKKEDCINNCDDDVLAKIIKDKRSNKFIRRIKVIVPPTDEFKDFFDKNNSLLVLRDTRGLLDFEPEEAEKVQYKTMMELGIDGIDAVLLLGTSARFPNITEWYKDAYKSVFESVPVFIMTRTDSFSVVYDIWYESDGENATRDHVRDFLRMAKKGDEKGFKKLHEALFPCYELLEMFEIGKISGAEFRYKYKVYNNEDLCYFYPYSSTLAQAGNNPDNNSADYKLYELTVYENLKDMFHKMMEHNRFIEVANSQIKLEFAAALQRDSGIKMCPDYTYNYNRKDVCDSILCGDILGPRGGIVTTEQGTIRYLGAVTSGVSARMWLQRKVRAYEYSEKIKNADGSEMVCDMPEECQKNLVRMALFNIIERNTDSQAYFQKNYFMNRHIVKKAILNVRKNGITGTGDALDDTCKEIAKIIF